MKKGRHVTAGVRKDDFHETMAGQERKNEAPRVSGEKRTHEGCVLGVAATEGLQSQVVD